LAIWFIRIAVLYLVFGVIFGQVMGITQRFAYADVHAHINLLGWATLALSGVIYTIFPSAGKHRLATVHFWLHNTGLPIFVVGLFLLATNDERGLPFAIVGSTLAILGLIVFATNVWLNAKPVTA
jgi:cbb3-type cytochrome oxidase subunit 1